MDHHREQTQHHATSHPPAEEHEDLRVCLGCSSDLVYPVEIEKAAPDNWSVLLRCPNCDVYRDGTFSQRTVDSLDEELDRDRAALAREYESVLRSNMSAEIERFVGALNAGAILPEDF